jgi:hypothetical protein
MTRWLSALGLLAAGTVLFAGDANKTAKIQVTSLSIYKAPPPKPGTFMAMPNGLSMEVMVSLPGRYITGVDAKESPLDHFKDDKDNVLFKKSRGLFGGGTLWVQEYGTRITPDGEAVTVMIRGTEPPGKGAERILLKGSLNVKCGSDAKVTETKEMAMKPKEEAEVGPFKVRVGQFGSSVEVVSNEENIKNVEFLEDKSKVITTGMPNRVQLPSEKGKMSYHYNYFLVGKREKFSVKVHYFTKVETVKVPLDLHVGLGLE